MKRIVLLISTLFMLIVLLAACGPKGIQDTISNTLGIDVSDGKELSNYDTHSGNGDGVSCVVISFDDNAVLEEIKNNADWKEFPLDETVQTLVYGVSDETFSIGPFLADKDGNTLVPEVQNGYYLLIDRHADTETNILNRASFNFTLGVYDVDTTTLYFCKLDT